MSLTLTQPTENPTTNSDLDREPRTFRQVSEDDLNLLKGHQRKILEILRRNPNQFVSSSHLKFETQTKHAPRRIQEIQAAGFRIEVKKEGQQNAYRYTGEILINS